MDAPIQSIDTASPDPISDAAGFGAVRRICRRHAKSFYFASHFLPRPKRDAAYAVYAFCRMIDDAIDQDDDAIETTGPAARASATPPHQPASVCGPTSPLDARLNLFHARLDEIYDRRLALPPPDERSEAQHALHAFALTVHRYAIPKQYFLDLAAGCRMDLTVSRYATWAALDRYCYHVAGVVGLIMSSVFGLSDASAREQAVLMGNAMQLTNILRDVREDRERGRIYLPLEDMVRFRYSEADLNAGIVNDAFRELMRFQIARARDLYRRGAEGLCFLEGDGSRLTAAVMAVIYGGILGEIERRGYDIFAARASLTRGQKLRRLPLAWRVARRRRGRPLPQFV